MNHTKAKSVFSRIQLEFAYASWQILANFSEQNERASERITERAFNIVLCFSSTKL